MMRQPTASPRFCERKAAQAVGVLLRTHPKSRFEYMRVLKLLYIAARECLQERHHFLLADRIVAMKHGPVFSRVYDLMMDSDPESPEWSRYFRRDGYDIEQVANPGVDLLSKYEIEKLTELAERFRRHDVWTLSDETHDFDEWRKAWEARGDRKAAEIEWGVLAGAVGMSPEDLEEAIREAAFADAMPHTPGSPP